MKEKNIMYDSNDAAVYEERTLNGWWSRKGSFFGDGESSEDLARLDGCTHVICKKCDKQEHPKHRALCEECNDKKKREKAVIWDGVTPVFFGDNLFFDYQYFFDYCEEHDIEKDQAILELCEPIKLRKIDESRWEDQLPEGVVLSDAVVNAIEALNAELEKESPGWVVSGKYAVTN